MNLSWLQKGYDTPEYRDLLAGLSPDEDEERRGECIYRDVQSRIGKIKIQLPLDPKTRKATLTTPPKTRSPGEPGGAAGAGAGSRCWSAGRSLTRRSPCVDCSY